MSMMVAIVFAAAPLQAGEIVVTGQSKTPEEERKEIRDYIRKAGVAKGELQAARWVEPVCPKVYGVPANIGDRVIARVRAVAQEASIRVAKPDCRPNIAITFVYDGAGFAQAIQKRSHRHISSMTLQDKAELLKSDAPIRWWYGIGPTDRDGGVPGSSGTPATFGGGEGGVSPIASVAGDAPTTNLFSSSLVRTSTVRTISTATVVIDVIRADGTPLAAVADYAAFVALAEIDPPKVAPPQSILTLFAGGADGLTDRDRDLLAALYKIPLDRQAFQQRNRLTGKMVRAAKD